LKEKDDIYLFNRIAEGNKDSYDIIFRKYYSQLCRFAYTYVKDADIAEDVVQGMFINLWTKKKKIKIITSLKSYLYTSVKNFSLNEIKKIKLREFHGSNSIDKNLFLDESLEFNSQEFKHIYEESIEQLPPKTAQVYILSRDDGLTYAEIAIYLNISQKTVENHIGIALKKIRKILKPYLKIFYDS